MIEGCDFAAVATIGARTRQEDDWGTHVNPPTCEPHARLLAAVADGMGGMPAGDQASGIALRTFLDSYRAVELPVAERMRHALAHANREVGIAVEAHPELEGMGCTLVAALFFPDRCEWLSVGDSLILLIRDGRLTRINPLHVYAVELDELVRRGELSEKAARTDPERAALTSAIQGSVLEEVAQGALPLKAGDLLLLASDGILTLTNEEIVSACTEQAEHGAESVARAIINRIDAMERPNQDNATLVVVRDDAKANDCGVSMQQAGQGATAAGEEAADRVATPLQSSGGRLSDSLKEELRDPSAPTDGAADATGTDSAKSIAALYVTGGTEQKALHRQDGRKRALDIQWPWLIAAFVLGALCGAVGCRMF